MSGTSELSIYETTFAKTDKTDAILVVGGKKLHVNKAVLSYHSDYFSALFNSEFKEKSIEEIEIKDVKFEDFAVVLSLVHKNPMKPMHAAPRLTIFPPLDNSDKFLELADRFMLPAAKRFVEFFLYENPKVLTKEKIRLADKYHLEDLLEVTIASLESQDEFKGYSKMGLSDATKSKLFDRISTILNI
uniref:BTB domain-containing protein n=1 Tax=Caenorhabditis tropicalis TaxID=1561998 RepID=A0A1I7UI49_9PELO